ncbi:MAG: putative O-glycosylation ligase, exosortase A system-associated [Methylobacter sp.]|nr:MAG: putative O-glycosylation ligase, exosortase A system-associated [Methylobacter sp.]
MRDIAVLIFLALCIFAAVKKPWYGVLSLAIFSYLNPHAYAWGSVRFLPVYMVLFLVVSIRTFNTKDKQPLPNDWRVKTFICLWLYYFITCSAAYLPDIAWSRLWTISKIYLPFIFTLLLINTREKLFYLIVTMAASIGVVSVKGGIFAVLTGFAGRVYGPPLTQFEENNLFAVTMLMNVPLLLIWRHGTSNMLIKKAIFFSIPIIYCAALSSFSRGALLTMTALTLLLLWHSKHKLFAMPMIFVGAVVASGFLPQSWYERMNTLQTYDEDSSAMGRIVVWIDGWKHTLDHPLTGTGFDGWIYLTERDWHSSYVEMFSEHGFIAFGLWISLIVGTLMNLSSLAKKTKNIAGMEWASHTAYMLRASLVCYMVGGAFLGLSYFDFLYHIIFIAVLLKKFILEELAVKEGAKPKPRWADAARQVPNGT